MTGSGYGAVYSGMWWTDNVDYVTLDETGPNGPGSTGDAGYSVRSADVHIGYTS